jgi:hypothetical protein
MPITSLKNIDEFGNLFKNLPTGTKACLFVFLTKRIAQTSGEEIRVILNQLDTNSAKENRTTQIFFPAFSEDSDNNSVIKKLWEDYNKEKRVPLFLFTDISGADTAISFAGIPTSDDLIKKLRLLVPNP